MTSIRGVPVSGFLAMEIPEGEDRSLGEEALETMERASSWAERLRERNVRPYG